ncbi:MAG TPA: helix-turn-helix domain-containing protein [Armatimonadota bacterium]
MSQQPASIRFAQFFRDGFPLEIMPIRHHGATGLHQHEFSELVIVLSGTGIHRSPAGDYRIDAGDAFVLHGNQAHGYRDPENLNLVNILFRMDELAIPLQDVASLPGYHALFTLEPLYRERDRFESRLRLAPDELRHVSNTLERLIHEGRNHPPGWRFATMAGFMLLVTDLSRYYAGREERAAQPLLSLGRVIGHLEQHYNQPLTLDELATLGCMSRRTLCREFHRALGCSPIEYLIRIRVNHAARLLQESAESVTEVAFQVGFNDSNYFARQFRALQGASPRDFRRATVRS